MNKTIAPLAALLLGTVLAQTAPATTAPAAPAQPSPIQIETTQARVETVEQEGRTVERLVALPNTAQANPGQLLQQTVMVRNTLTRPVTGLKIDLPVPQGMVFVNTAATLQNIRTEFSFDGGRTFGPAPLKRRVTVTENGQQVTREVTVQPSEYTNVRWYLAELPARGEARLGMRVRVR